MLEKAVGYLITDINGIYIDGTAGGGGHSEEILRRLGQGGKLFAFDKDSEAITFCEKRFAAELEKGAECRLTLLNGSYTLACSIEGIGGKIRGLLLDLGVSSRQLDSRERGFSYRENARLDMRFAGEGTTAEALLNTAKEEYIEKILRQWGEEPFARTIARCIAKKRRAAALRTTFDLKDCVEESVPGKLLQRSLSRVFQAIRIATNDELTELESTLNGIVPLLAQGARLVIISYHSLEDRIVKNIFRTNAGINVNERFTLMNTANHVPSLTILTKKPIIPDEEEIKINIRARSAKMRVAERI
ncbi:MAG: rsmH [Ignavibacteria bacterium]|nr:rsmH [Ignavibacteria bacterium]